MKVLHLITKSNWGGAQRCVYDLALGAREAGFEVVVALGGDGRLAAKLREAGVKVVSLPSLGRDVSVRGDLAAARDTWRLLRAERPDVLHLHSSKAGGLGALLGRLARVPAVVFTAHGWAFNEPRPEWQRALIKILHVATVLLAHRTIAVAAAIPRQLGFSFLLARRFEIIRNGVEVPALLPESEARAAIATLSPAAAAVLAAHPEDPLIVTLAELHRVKGLDTLVEAADDLRRRHPTVRFGIIVLGEGEARAALQATIDSRGLGETVALAGFAPEAPTLLGAFDILAMPSRSEAMPLSLLEAGAAGLACVASRVGGIPEVLESREVGLLVSPERSRELAEALRYLLENPAAAKKMGAALQAQILARFSRDRVSTETLALYARLVDARG